MYNATLKFKCQFCAVAEAVGEEKLTEQDRAVIRIHLVCDHGWICEEEFQTWR